MNRMNKKHPFLDLKLKLNEGKISTDLYTNRHQYLHFTSSHTNHTYRSVVYSQGVRVKRLCSEKKDLKLWFLKPGYPQNIFDQELAREG